MHGIVYTTTEMLYAVAHDEIISAKHAIVALHLVNTDSVMVICGALYSTITTRHSTLTSIKHGVATSRHTSHIDSYFVCQKTLRKATFCH